MERHGNLGVIRKLDTTVVNRIAAGEVVIRPANALKEMIENSLDAQATHIKVLVKSGGSKLLQIQDNGTGIIKEDLDIVCERFTTSKLSKFEDLINIGTYGFRGEALASISHIAHVTIVSKTDDSTCAYKVGYKNGKPDKAPTLCAGTTGTIIKVEDLFYNMPIRKMALKSASEEFSKILDVIIAYAIHNYKVSFTLKKEETSTGIRTPGNSTLQENICLLFGANVSRELLEIDCEDDKLKFKAKALISNIEFSMKKLSLLLFINNRLVNSSVIKMKIESIYHTFLEKNCYPFIYLRLDISPQNIDVNVHPTKEEVRFLYEDEIAEKITHTMYAKLIGTNAPLKQASFPTSPFMTDSSNSSPTSSALMTPKLKRDGRNLVRTDSKEQKIDAFLVQKKSEKEPTKQNSKRSEHDEEVMELESILTLKKEVSDACHGGLREIIQNHTFVGCITRENALIQHQTKLYVANTTKLSEELFYQLLLKDFGKFKTMIFDHPMPLYELAMIALSLKDGKWCLADGPKEDIANYAVELLQSKAEMLEEYFGIEITWNGKLRSIPLLLVGYSPNLLKMPLYILHLATEVNWETERECFESFFRATARFFAISKDPEIMYTDESVEEKNIEFRRTVEHIFYPAMKSYLLPPNHFADNVLSQAANLPDLYNVFERC